MPHAMFRPRRLPEKRLLRRMVRETTDDLVCCLFAVHGRGTALLARCAGLLGHIAEEIRRPVADSIYRNVERNAEYIDPS